MVGALALSPFHAFLFQDWGFKFVEVKDDFGGNVAIAQSDDFRLRFIRDRADFFLDVGKTNEPEKWIGFYKILDELKAKGLILNGYKYTNKIRVVSSTLNQHLIIIRDAVK